METGPRQENPEETRAETEQEDEQYAKAWRHYLEVRSRSPVGDTYWGSGSENISADTLPL